MLEMIEDAGEDCIHFQGKLDRDGYGVVVVGGRRHTASRVALASAQEPPTENSVCRHTCDGGRSCVNPNHLTWVERRNK